MGDVIDVIMQRDGKDFKDQPEDYEQTVVLYFLCAVSIAAKATAAVSTRSTVSVSRTA